MSEIFISHSCKDGDQAQEVRDRLEARDHHSVFLDFDPQKGIPAGKSWEQHLYRELGSCRAVIIVCTDNWLSSRWCFTEAAVARMLNRAVFVVKCEPWKRDSNLPENLSDVPPILKSIQYIDLRLNPDEGWRKLWRGLRENGIDPGWTADWDRRRAPYPGMLAFEREDEAVFFGRERERDALMNLLEQASVAPFTSLVMVLGPSGTGKSSLVRAGLVPALARNEREWIVVEPFRPRREPMAELVASLAHTFPRSADEIRAKVERGEEDLSQLVRWLRRDTDQREATVLIVVDQFEELLVSGPDSEDDQVERANRFLEYLRCSLRTKQTDFLVLGTMRSEYLGAFQENRLTRDIAFDDLKLPPIPFERLRTIIEEPARKAALTIEGTLVDALLADTRTEDALPLLAFILRKMWDEEVFREDECWQLREYEELGRLKGAVAKAAEALYSQVVDASNEDAFYHALLSMVRSTGEGSFARRTVLWADVPEAAKEPLQAFVDRRLLVRFESTVSIAHDALFEHWPRLDEWIKRADRSLQLVQEAEHCAKAWQEQGFPARLQWSDERVVEAIGAYDRVTRKPSDLVSTFLGPLNREEMRLWLERSDTTHDWRASIGVRLALLGDQRPGVGLKPNGLPDHVWCDIPEGSVTICEPESVAEDAISKSRSEGWQIVERKKRNLPEGGKTLTVGSDTQLTRYPVTWMQYRAFLEDNDGFQDDSWWIDPGKRGDRPPIPSQRHDNRPADGLSWYDAVAYTRWLSAKLGYEVRLPTEWEWIQAATGGDMARYRYPWGREWNPAMTNTWESRLRKTTAVGMYPQAMSPTGVMDMAGNAWEWCLNTWAVPITNDPKAEGERTVHGASCIVEGEVHSRTAYAGLLDPRARYVTGFRLARRRPNA